LAVLQPGVRRLFAWPENKAHSQSGVMTDYRTRIAVRVIDAATPIKKSGFVIPAGIICRLSQRLIIMISASSCDSST
ncbi:hypothetical protein, partial [Pantoea sp. Ft-CA_14]|uniref:hypothetical protein n=1 Tax=Pantoea sp. Ft-CA_14 TaxID=2929507 RepID=UPI0021194857